MKNNDNYFDLEDLLKDLEKVAKEPNRDSGTYYAIEISTKALLFIEQGGLKKSFEKYLSEFNDELSEDQKQFLKDNNIDNNDFAS